MFNKKKLTIIVLAGGLGTRIRDTIGDLPKILAPIGDETFLFYFLKWINPLLKLNRCNLIFSLCHKSDLVINYLNKKNEEFSVTLDNKPLGTFGAICNSVLKYPSDNYLILNGDTIFSIDFLEIYKQFLKNSDDPLLILKKNYFSERYGGYSKFKKKWFFTKDDCEAISMGAYFITYKELLRRWKISTKLEFTKINLEKKIRKPLMNDDDCLAISPVNGYILMEEKFFIDIGVKKSLLEAQSKIPSYFLKSQANY